MMALNMDEAEKECSGAVTYLLEHERSNGQVGSVGFCLGGGLSVWAAPRTTRSAPSRPSTT